MEVHPHRARPARAPSRVITPVAGRVLQARAAAAQRLVQVRVVPRADQEALAASRAVVHRARVQWVANRALSRKTEKPAEAPQATVQEAVDRAAAAQPARRVAAVAVLDGEMSQLSDFYANEWVIPEPIR